MAKRFLQFVFLALTFLAHAQAQPGFINIDCGIADGDIYTDEITGLDYVSDADFIDTGVSKNISPTYNTNGDFVIDSSSSKPISPTYETNRVQRQFSNVRSFPEGIKNCYTLTPPRLKNRTRYFIRARFMYGNYDGKNQLPKFDLYLGVNYWATVELIDAATRITFEILHVPSSNDTYVCLVNIGSGTPFLSVLDLRLVDDVNYPTVSGVSLELFGRYDLRSYTNTAIIRYKDDIYDRIWHNSFFSKGVSNLSTSIAIEGKNQNTYKVPSAVMTTAVTPENANEPLEFYWEPTDPTVGYYIYMHFADFQSIQSREFDIIVNEKVWHSGLTTDYLSTTTILSTEPETPAARVNFSLVKTENSTLPPILNALELYAVKELLNLRTDQEDVDAIKEIKATYGVKKNWQGDPCTPQAFSWEGINCLNVTFEPPRITSLNLSSSGLTGNISPFILNLKMLQYLDLSNNSLTGEIPGSLSQMKKLTVLKLTGNNLNGTIPAELIKKSKSGTLKLSLDPNLCLSEPCKITPAEKEPNGTKKKNKTMQIVPIVAAVAAVSALLLAFAIWWIFFLKKKKPKQQQQQGRVLDTTKRQFTYSEVLIITNNLETVIGKGGFGPVYHGYLEDTEVAVKMLSSSSIQGYKEFSAEIDFLTRVHHINLTTLVGYCDEGDNVGLIYEYMANGNLREHLSATFIFIETQQYGQADRHPTVLSWGERLQIALDAATGLEYLHTSCKPPIIHRDVKSANILLNEKFQAKLADFGMSKDFPVDNTHVSTAIAGTPGYLDPEYYISYKLTEKSDIFSFGVVLLEIITSRPVITRDQDNAHIIQWVSFRLAREEDLGSIVDARLGGDFEVNSIQKAIEIAMACASPTSIQRPTMNHVVMELKQCLAIERARKNEGYRTELEDSSVGTSLNFITQSSFGAR